MHAPSPRGAPPDAHSVEHLPHGGPLLHRLLPACATVPSLRALHARLLAHGLLRALRARTKLLSCYAALGDLASARRVLDETPRPDPYTYRVALGWHAAAGRHAEARLHCDAVKAGGADGFVMNCLVDMYAKAGDLENARKVFDRILSRNVVSWTSMLSGCLQNGLAQEGLALFNEMREERMLPSEYTMASVLTACTMLSSLHQGRWVHGSVIKHGMVFNPFVTAAMLDMYVKCGQLEDARRLFDELGFVDLVLWTTMIVGYTQNGSPLDALLLFAGKKFVRIVPNSVTIATVLSASAQLRNLSLGRLIHGMSVKLGVVEKDVVMNALVDMYAKCKAGSEANGIFGRISNKDVVTWNSLIAGYVENDMGNEALMLFSQMRVQGSSPDAISVVNALSACVCFG
ncbi:unnamed protein product [Triticum turgidum subsp. durum]|uniref:Pentatricopeptide repeat-containing protein n=1 Tax=Triticum turgidum subsp. durum TaxID=4567 RepID=A0A9R0ZVP3_TRITD|nr:unnamed protein product [Triticum turgidum subsp. durum]